ncbi:MAG: phospholipid carrier-dependent glycosyltransferase [Parvibaculaceae bacterium]
MLVLAIILAGAFARIAGTGWDEGAGLHPDERHMLFVSMDAFRGLDTTTLGPTELWFATGRSPLDPRLKGQNFVYGELPHLTVTLLGRLLGLPGWPELQRLGRLVGAVLDSYTILAVFLLAWATWRSRLAGICGAVLYAFAPLAVQHANFFTVDVWLTAATAWGIFFAVMLYRARSSAAALGWAALTGFAAALALATKLPGLAVWGTLGAAVVLRWLVDRRSLAHLLQAAMQLAIGSLVFLVAFRLVSPFSFEGPGLFSILPSQGWINGYLGAANLVHDPNFPPNWQWSVDPGWRRPAKDLVVWAFGLPATAMLALSFLRAILRPRAADIAALVPGLLVLAYLVYWLSGPIPALRYVLPAFPALCALAGGLAAGTTMPFRVGALLLGLGGVVWGMGMVSIHTSVNTRLLASRWMWQELPAGTTVANETPWDDGLPVPVSLKEGDTPVWPDRDAHFRFLLLGMEIPDSADKARGIAAKLEEADVFIIPSQRMRQPILGLPGRFPMSSAFYRHLAAGDLCFERAFRVVPGYRVAGIRFDDSQAQEPWSVYDHAPVEIYRKLPCFDRSKVERLLLQALDKGS